MLAPPRKRPRSPSPASDDLTSPLDILLKRRRQRGEYNGDADDYIAYDPSTRFETTEAESSSAPWTRFIEKRRTRQWEILNNPPRHTSQPSPNRQDDYSSPIRPRMYSQPESLSKVPMSSSPIHHQPPSSSPFKPSGPSTKDDNDGEDEDMDEDEMKREWGDEYYSQNSLLRNLVSHSAFDY